MAGIYIHIPFCKQACHYCDFHFSTNLSLKVKMAQALLDELRLRKDFFNKNTPVQNIYFGGGSPSLLEASWIDRLLTAIHRDFEVVSNPEITLEANPDDLKADKIAGWKAAGINRLSIGIQTFNDRLLKFLNRAHNASEAIAGYRLARKAGIDNINCDLIYAIPGQGLEGLRDDLRQLQSLAPEHISAYCLTIEEKTAFGSWSRTGKLSPVEEEEAAEHFELTASRLQRGGYERYEISNFCLPGFESRHNCSYWKDEPYLGIGPGAHAYDGRQRGYNIRNNSLFIKAISENRLPFVMEDLSYEDQVNDYLLTSLRAKWGCDLDYMKRKFRLDLLEVKRADIDFLTSEELINLQAGALTVSEKGKLLADYIASRLFIESE